MDISLARTFLTVASTGSFVAAAEKLNITQTAVSARIRTLEEQLGRPLFVRGKTGARLTTAGERFFRHATALVRTWEEARQQIAAPAGKTRSVSVGAELSLWDPALTDWLGCMRRECPQIAIRVEVDGAERILEKLRNGELDVAVLHAPPQQPDLVLELLCEERLILVTTAEDGGMLPDDYIFVDWGPAFAASHSAAATAPLTPSVCVNLGPLARHYMLAVGGCGYFRQRSVTPLIETGRLRPVAEAPEFSHSIYLVYSAQRDKALIELVRPSLRECFARL